MNRPTEANLRFLWQFKYKPGPVFPGRETRLAHALVEMGLIRLAQDIATITDAGKAVLADWEREQRRDVDAKELLAAATGSDIIDEAWLKRCGWIPIGNTWYPPEDSHPRQYTTPILFWVRVDGTIRLGGGNEWTSENDAKRSHLRLLCVALGINLTETVSPSSDSR